MSTYSRRDLTHVFEKLIHGLVPERALDAYAVGIEKERAELHRQFELLQDGEGAVKFLRGGYGCGKTFMARLAVLDAQARGFATSFVVVSDNDLRFHRFDDVYRKVVSELGTTTCPRGALGDILDRWIVRIEEGLIELGHDEDAEDFDDKVREQLKRELAEKTSGKAPEDFIRVVRTIFDLKQEGEVAEAGALISWLAGSGNVSASAKKAAGIKGDITSGDALEYLRGILEITKSAGYQGLVIVIDEAETILRMRSDSRHKSLNGIRQIVDAAGQYPGLLWLFTGTPEFFDSRHGVANLQPLHDRIRFMKEGGFANRRQAQLELTPFKADRLRKVAVQLRDLYPAQNPDRLRERIDDAFIEGLVDEVSKGFGGDVGVVPRQFLRELVNQLGLVDDNEDYDPKTKSAFDPGELNAQEAHAAAGTNDLPSPEEDEAPIGVEDVW